MTEYTWTGNGDGTSWANDDNWSTPDADPATSTPGGGDNAQFSTAATIEDSGSADDITIDASLDLDGGSLTAGMNIFAYAELTAESGSITSKYLAIYDTADFDDTTITTSSFFKVDGGTVTASNGTQIEASSDKASVTSFITTDGGSIDLEGQGTSLTGEGPGGAVIGYTGSGSLTIDDGATATFGSDLTYEALGIGFVSGNGTVTVEGSGSTLTVDDSGAQVDSDAGSTGSLTIKDGGTANFQATTGYAPLAVGQGGTGDVTVTGSGSSLTASGGSTIIGLLGGTGTFEIDDGATISISNEDPSQSALFVGSGNGSTGTLTVDGTGSSLTTSDGTITVGNVGATGTLDIDDGATVSATGGNPSVDSVLEIGDAGTGTATVDGSGSSIETTNGNAAVGLNAGDGTLTVQSEGEASFTSASDINALYIGSGSGSTGTLNVTGSGSTLTVTGGGGIVGLDDGMGTLSIDDGASATFSGGSSSTSLDIGRSGGTGAVTLTGAGSSFDIDEVVNVGVSGTGFLTIDDGATFTSTYGDGASIDIGVSTGGDGTMTVSDADVDLDKGDGIIIGNGATGSLIVDDGATFSVTSATPNAAYAATVGAAAAGDGTLTVYGAGSTFTADDGGLAVGNAGSGSATVYDGGELFVDDTTYGLIIAGSENSTGDLTVTGSGSGLSNKGPTLVGSSGTGYLTIDDGATFVSTYADGASIDIGADTTGAGTMTVSDVGTDLDFDHGDGIIIGDAGTGTLEVDDGATFSITSVDPDGTDAAILGNQANSTGTLDVDGAGSTFIADDGGLGVGGAGSGYVTVSDGGALGVDDSTFGLIIAAADDSFGDVVVTGSGSDLETTGPVYVGSGGTGYLTIDDSASFSSTYADGASVDIGFNLGANGTMTVSDSGTDLDLEAGLGIIIGDEGTGTFEVDDGATFTVATTDSTTTYGAALGNNTTGAGGLIVDGAGSTFTAGEGGLAVGTYGSGTVTISDGGTLNVTDATYGVVVAAADDSTGDVTITGDGSILDSQGPVAIGLGGTGTVTVDDSATLKIEDGGDLDLGIFQDSDGTFDLDGAGATLDYSGVVTVGDGGSGTFKIEDGASWTSQDNIIAGNDEDSSGTILITGADSALTVGGDLTIGDDGVGTLTVDDAGALTVRGKSTEAADDNSTSTTTIDGKGTTVTYDGDDIVGSSGMADDTISGGATGTISGDLTLGENESGNGKLILTGDGTSLDTGSGTVTIGAAGTGEIDVDDGASLTSTGTITIGDQEDSNGTLLVDGDGSSVDPADMTVGGQGTGTVTLSNGGSLEVNTLTIGDEDNGDGTVTVADADSSLNVDVDLQVGNGAKGTLVVDGDTTVSGDTSVGAEDGGNGQITVNIATLELDGGTKIGEASTGAVLVQQGGTLTAHEVTLGESLGGDGTLTLSGDGTTGTTDALTVGGAGQGTLEVDDGASLTSSADSTLGESVSANIQKATIESGGSWTIAGGGLTVGDAGIATMNVKTGGNVSASGDIVLGDQGAATGELDVSDLASDGVTPSSVNFGGKLTVGGAGKGTLTISAGASVAPNSGGAGTIEIAAEHGSNGTVTVEGKGSELQGDALSVGGTSTEAGGAGSLSAETGGSVDVQSILMWNGTIDVDNQSLVSIGAGAAAVASGLDVQSGATLSGFGSITGLIENDGGITASGGVLKLDDAVSGGGAELIDRDATLALFSGVAANQTVSFAAGSGAHWGTLDLSGEGTGLTFAAPISGFTGDGATASLSDVIEVAGSGGTDHVVWTQNTGLQGTLQIETSADAVLETLTLEGSYNQNQFTLTDPAVVDQITYNTACYARGTRILTQRGEIAIEALCIGDLAVTDSGALRPIVWLGHRRIDISRHPDPAAVQPVRVLAGAFGEALPRRDLWLSPGHNVAFEDALMPISCLINGRSVAQIKQASVEYWHVELDAHDIILAEGLPAESYLDCGNRTAFANGGAFVEAHPDFQPKHSADTCLPLMSKGPSVARTKARLLARLAEQGAVASQAADAHIVVDGVRIEPIRVTSRRLAFALPAGGKEIALRSNVFIPAHTVPESADTRTLGLCVGRLQIDGLDINLAQLAGRGWLAAELADGRVSHRWTGGAARLAAGARIVIVDLAGDGCYPRSQDQRFVA